MVPDRKCLKSTETKKNTDTWEEGDETPQGGVMGWVYWKSKSSAHQLCSPFTVDLEAKSQHLRFWTGEIHCLRKFRVDYSQSISVSKPSGKSYQTQRGLLIPYLTSLTKQTTASPSGGLSWATMNLYRISYPLLYPLLFPFVWSSTCLPSFVCSFEFFRCLKQKNERDPQHPRPSRALVWRLTDPSERVLEETFAWNIRKRFERLAKKSRFIMFVCQIVKFPTISQHLVSDWEETFMSCSQVSQQICSRKVHVMFWGLASTSPSTQTWGPEFRKFPCTSMYIHVHPCRSMHHLQHHIFSDQDVPKPFQGTGSACRILRPAVHLSHASDRSPEPKCSAFWGNFDDHIAP